MLSRRAEGAMKNTDDDAGPNDDTRTEELIRHRTKFFALIGHCLTSYQSVEDYLEEVFSAALGDDLNRGAAIYAVARGLEARLDIITAALTGRPSNCAKYWPDLRARIASAARARNEIAHATTLFRADSVKVIINRETMQLEKVERTEDGRMELRKKTRVGETIWTLDKMFAEYNKTEKLFVNLRGYVKILQGENPSASLLDGLKG